MEASLHVVLKCPDADHLAAVGAIVDGTTEAVFAEDLAPEYQPLFRQFEWFPDPDRTERAADYLAMAWQVLAGSEADAFLGSLRTFLTAKPLTMIALLVLDEALECFVAADGRLRRVPVRMTDRRLNSALDRDAHAVWQELLARLNEAT